MKPLLLVLLPSLAACASTSLTHKIGRLRVHPIARVELSVDPRTSK